MITDGQAIQECPADYEQVAWRLTVRTVCALANHLVPLQQPTTVISEAPNAARALCTGVQPAASM